MNTLNTNATLHLFAPSRVDAISMMANPTAEMQRYEEVKIHFPEYEVEEWEYRSDGCEWVPTGKARGTYRRADVPQSSNWSYPEDKVGETHWGKIYREVMNSITF